MDTIILLAIVFSIRLANIRVARREKEFPEGQTSPPKSRRSIAF